MPRNYHLKNPDRKGAKLSPAVRLAIQREYCEGSTQTQAARNVSAWAESNGFAKASRQAINTLYAEIGDKLFHLAYIDKHGPRSELICDQCRTKYVSVYRHYLYAHDSFFREERDRISDEYWKLGTAQTTRMAKQQFHEHTYSELIRTSASTNGLLEKTFYVQWARAYWMRKLRHAQPKTSRTRLTELLLEITSRQLPMKKGTQCHASVPIEFVGYRYFRMHGDGGWVRLGFHIRLDKPDQVPLPHTAHRILSGGLLVSDSNYIDRVFFDINMEYEETTAEEFAAAYVRWRKRAKERGYANSPPLPGKETVQIPYAEFLTTYGLTEGDEPVLPEWPLWEYS